MPKKTLHKDANGVKPMEALWSKPEDIEMADDIGVSVQQLVIDVQGFEGPLDLLLHLARSQKVDLTHISIVALVEQYLNFVEEARLLRLELAADYLVMAAWLAYLKSRLLIPKTKSDQGESGEELAEILQFRLKRLEAMREAAKQLMNSNQLGQDVFKRAFPEMVVVEKKHRLDVTLYELLMAYASLRQKQSVSHVEVGKRTAISLKSAREILNRLLGVSKQWQALDLFIFSYIPNIAERRSALASAFAASLEMVREGQLDISQNKPFSPIYLRAHEDDTGDNHGK